MNLALPVPAVAPGPLDLGPLDLGREGARPNA